MVDWVLFDGAWVLHAVFARFEIRATVVTYARRRLVGGSPFAACVRLLMLGYGPQCFCVRVAFRCFFCLIFVEFGILESK